MTHYVFPEYSSKVKRVINGKKMIADFTSDSKVENSDEKVVFEFGEEWSKFNAFEEQDIKKLASEYFDILPAELGKTWNVLDVGCGTGRWSKVLANKVGTISLIDPSQAIMVADRLLESEQNIQLAKAYANSIPFADNTFDLVMSIGVLHHIPDTESAMLECVKKVKSGGYFYTYLYYSLDNRPLIFRFCFKIANLLRRIVSILPKRMKHFVCELIAIFVYMPLVTLSRVLRKLGFRKASDSIPLSSYSDKSFHIIRNDALDRFGTRLEQRFSKKEIASMMSRCGLSEVTFSEHVPYWHAIGKKKSVE